MKHTVRTLQAPVQGLLHAGAVPSELAAAALVTWRGVEAMLAPVFGSRGFCAMFGRSLFLAREAHAWLPTAPVAASSSRDLFGLFEAALAAQPAAEAAAAHAAMLETFCGVLASLIGGPLTERVLRPVLDGPNGHAGDASP